ncbi:MAG: hypothetical protein ACR2PR_06430 [Pseudohongiellaceae bacterium]
MQEQMQEQAQEHMQEQNTSRKKLGDKEIAALVTAATVIGFFAVYWFLQIQSVRELLELAYG